MANESPTKHDYDSKWKEVITNLFENFVEFFLPELYPLVDWSQPYYFLDKEFQKIVKDEKVEGKSYKDKLVQVSLKSGEAHFVLIHIEVQSSYEADFPSRMFKYFYRIRDHFDLDVTAIAVYTNNEIPKVNDRYIYNHLGTELVYKFNTYKIKDAAKEELMASLNPFALVVLASQYLNESMKDGEKRFRFKVKLIELAKQKKYTNEQIANLLLFIEYLLILPVKQQLKYEEVIQQKYLKTIKTMEATESSKRIMSYLYEQIFGYSPQKEREDAIMKERQEAEKKQAAAIQKALKEQEAALKEQEAMIIKAVHAFSKLGMDAEKIANTSNIPLEKVLEILAQIKQ